jgi:hypothetical protein
VDWEGEAAGGGGGGCAMMSEAFRADETIKKLMVSRISGFRQAMDGMCLDWIRRILKAQKLSKKGTVPEWA